MRVFATGWSEGFDGPGRRFVYYLKGCNFRCRWCANPEGLEAAPEMLFYESRAAHAAEACPHGAVRCGPGGAGLDRTRCAACADRACVRDWKHPAFEWAGRDVSPAEVEAAATRAVDLFGAGGGVTFGGGEATLQYDDLAEALGRLARAGVRAAVESNASTEGFRRLVGGSALLVCDLKCADPEAHRAWTGADGAPVVENLERAAREQRRLRVRVPLVTGLNDGVEAMARVVEFLGACARRRREATGEALHVEVLRLHHAGEPKYRALGRAYPMAGVPVPDEARARELVRDLCARGVEARVAGRDDGGIA